LPSSLTAELGLPGATEAAIVAVAAELLRRPIKFSSWSGDVVVLASLLGVVAVVGGLFLQDGARLVLLCFFSDGSVGELHVSLLLLLLCEKVGDLAFPDGWLVCVVGGGAGNGRLLFRPPVSFAGGAGFQLLFLLFVGWPCSFIVFMVFGCFLSAGSFGLPKLWSPACWRRRACSWCRCASPVTGKKDDARLPLSAESAFSIFSSFRGLAVKGWGCTVLSLLVI